MRNQVVIFVLGALLAGGVVFLTMRDKQPGDRAQVSAPLEIVPPANSPTPSTLQPNAGESPAVQSTPAPVAGRVPPRRSAKPAENHAPQHQNHGATTTAKTETPVVSPPNPAASSSTASLPPTTAPTTPAETASLTPHRSDPPPREAKTVTIPAGTLVSVRAEERISTETHHSGDSFRATLDQPLVVDNVVIAERGSRIEGRIAEADAAGRVRGLSRISLELVRLNTSDGQRVRLQTEPFTKEAQSTKGKDVAKVGAAAGIGAAIGALAGGGKGAAIGAAVGGAAGTGGVMATRGQAAEIRPETRMSFRLKEPITITEKLN